MSSVRMCDKCGVIFSENEEDWSTFEGTVVRRRENGSRYRESMSQDACPSCTAGNSAPAPRLAAELARPSSPAVPGHPDYARIAELERENGLTPSAVTEPEPGF